MAARTDRHSRGRAGETRAVWWLRLQGYRILARNWRHPLGEIDILARRGRLVIAVEVKWRDSFAQAAEAVQAAQRHRIAQAAAVFLGQQADAATLSLRFDAMLLVPGRWPRHIRDAWRI
ncbi:MAG: YraN family protein [Ferrovibrio sp.]|uniref:YraN family protein n=1 Tax=Ferrovibrio sp. TaxID=1917215 RepID=UPI002612FEAE|nr:YraN family protein [Ferrovibrio sp.]MCW0233950.1 YraN family protein [Ferrovibrio sp.]